MYSRKYSLKTRYNFGKALNKGETFRTPNLIVKYFKPKGVVFGADPVDKKFAVITSAKFSKKAVVQNKAKRIISDAIRVNMEKFPPFYYYVFIPKRRMLGEDGKVKIDAKTIDSEINTFLSTVDFS